MVYKCVLADPPWNEQGGGRIKRGAQVHYALMKTPAIAELLCRLILGYEDAYGVWHEAQFLVHDDAHLYLWATNNHLPDALAVMQALGFRYVNNKAWVKAVPFCTIEMPMAWALQRPGLEQYQGGQHELLLFGVRGKQPARWKDKRSGARRPGSVIMAARREHSRKPVEAYEHIENISSGPYLELFARGEARGGWDIWGDEARG